jgi:hypothetical protein
MAPDENTHERGILLPKGCKDLRDERIPIICMTKILSVTFATTTVLLAGCASDGKQTFATYHPAPFSEVAIPDNPPAKPPGTFPPKLSESECRDIVAAVDRLVMVGGLTSPPWPAPIQRLNPIEVNYGAGGVLIALYRDENEERGFYYHPPISSQSREESSPGWSWIALPHELYEYRRTKQAR